MHDLDDRPAADLVYRRFGRLDWARFIGEVSGERLVFTSQRQTCPFCQADDAFRMIPAGVTYPPRFRCHNCDRAGDLLDLTAELCGMRLEPRNDALDYVARWACEHELREVAEQPKKANAAAGGTLNEENVDDDDIYEVITILDVLDMKPTPHVIGDVLPSGEMSTLFGESNSFKSFLAIDMLCCVATGTEWHGCAVEKGPVLYIVSEGWKAAARKRIRAWFEEHEIPRSEWGSVKIIKTAVLLNRAEDVAKLLRTITARIGKARLICVDLLAGSMQGSESDSDVVSAWVRGCQQITETGAALLHVTHSGYSAAGRTRGHSHLWGSFSTRLLAEGNEASRTTVLSVNRHKDNDSTGQSWSFHLRQVPVGDEGETSLVVELIEGAARKVKAWPKSLLIFRQAFDAVADAVKPLKPFPDGPTVSAIPEGLVRDEFYKSHHADNDDPKKRQAAKRQAWNRVLSVARGANVIGYREVDGEAFLWLA